MAGTLGCASSRSNDRHTGCHSHPLSRASSVQHFHVRLPSEPPITESDPLEQVATDTCQLIIIWGSCQLQGYIQVNLSSCWPWASSSPPPEKYESTSAMLCSSTVLIAMKILNLATWLLFCVAAFQGCNITRSCTVTTGHHVVAQHQTELQLVIRLCSRNFCWRRSRHWALLSPSSRHWYRRKIYKRAIRWKRLSQTQAWQISRRGLAKASISGPAQPLETPKNYPLLQRKSCQRLSIAAADSVNRSSISMKFNSSRTSRGEDTGYCNKRRLSSFKKKYIMY